MPHTTARFQFEYKILMIYHPFDDPVYTYMEWRNVQRETMERLIGKHFEDADLDERAGFPASWGVMF